MPFATKGERESCWKCSDFRRGQFRAHELAGVSNELQAMKDSTRQDKCLPARSIVSNASAVTGSLK
ncbi:hypothetical protein GCM10017624_22410 [Azotobacter vinelandii]|nr:hypothetical protein GCM10017624_22410 [Azotobacter vinelandii]SFX32117.1 hypothetical protein SAMN04244547_01172 [Azotobacter vinelandii]